MDVLCSPWAVVADLPVDVRDGQDVTWLLDVMTAANQVVYALSGRQWRGSGCTGQVVIRPRSVWASAERGWHWSWGTHNCAAPCWCTRPWVLLPDGVRQVTQVTAGLGDDAEVIDPDTYVLVGRALQRVTTDGAEWSWPVGRVLTVDFTFGLDPPQAGRAAVVALAAEIVKGAAGGECALPRRVTTITRQGETLALLDPMVFLDNGKTGVYEVDLFLASFNPNKLARRPGVYSPDVS